MKTEAEIKALLEDEIENALGKQGDLSENRSDALDYYNGEKRGDEIEGRSAIVSTDVADAIEWIKPQILETFTNTDDVVRFDPESPEDEPQAEQETDYVNYVVTKENDWFSVISSMTVDALLQKNGYAKVYWEKPYMEREEYKGLNQMELGQVMDEGQVLEHNEYADEQGAPVYDVTIMRKSRPGCVKIEPVPPEEILISRDHNDVNLCDARFVAHERLVPASELIELGFDRAVVDELPDHEREDDEEEYSRRTLVDEQNPEASDTSMRLIRVYECYVRIDDNDDGIAELRQIVYAGQKILLNEEVDSIPFVSVTAIKQPHKHLGTSIFDRLKSTQDTKTSIIRQFLDNLYLTNNQRTYVNTQSGVNIDDLLTSRPGGLVRGRSVYQDAITPIQTPPINAQTFQLIQYIDKVREERSGVGAETSSEAVSVSNETAHGVERRMSAREKLVGLMIRTFAETGVKALFLKVRELLMKHQDKAKVVKLRGKWVEVNPAEWRNRMNTSIRVGLGTGDQMKKASGMREVLMAQEKLLEGGFKDVLVNANGIYKALIDAAGQLDIEAEPYFLDPNSPQVRQMLEKKSQEPPPPDPQMEMIKAQKEIEHSKSQIQQMKIQAEQSIKQQEMELRKLEQKNKEREWVLKEQELMYKLKNDEADDREVQAKLDLDKYKAELDAQTKIQVKEMDIQAKAENETEQLINAINEIKGAVTAINIPPTRKILRDKEGNIVGVE